VGRLGAAALLLLAPLSACSDDANDSGVVSTTADGSDVTSLSGGETGSEAGSGETGTGDDTGDGDGDGDSAATSSESGEDGTLLDTIPDTTGDPGGDEGCARMDLVFVMDISASMIEENNNIANNLDGFVDVLDDHIAADNGFESYRIGVTNSSINDGCTTLGLDGSLYNGEGLGPAGTDCPSYPDLWLDGPESGVAAEFACYADFPVPTDGGADCGAEMPLNVIEMFGDKLTPGGDNYGFYDVLDNSLLVFVILTDESEDPLSTTNAAATKAYLDSLAGGEDRYGVIVLAGPPPSGCDGIYGDAIYAEELESFANMVPNGYFNTLCTADLYLSVQEALEDMIAVCDALPIPQ
jgi:hypothetical protein